MTIVELAADHLSHLPPAKQRQVLDFIVFLEQQSVRGRKLLPPAGQRAPLHGLLSDQGIDVSSEDIDAMRREALRNFPSEDV